MIASVVRSTVKPYDCTFLHWPTTATTSPRLQTAQMASSVIKRFGSEDNYGNTQAVQVGDTVYISGQRSVDGSGRFVHVSDFVAQVKRTFANLDKCLAAVGAKRSYIVDERVFIVGPINHTLMYQSLHKVFFGDHRPVSTTIAVPGLAFKGQLIEVAVTLRLDMDSTKPQALVVKRFGYDLPHEETFGYTQVLQVGSTVYISGQLSHDEHGNFIGPGSFQKQIDQTYANLDKCITAIGASRNQVVNEQVLMVDSVKNASLFAAAHKKFYGDHLTTSTLIGVDFPVHLIEISATLQLDIDSAEVK